QAWAVYKGKYREGTKADPSTWKTRLRCALNKSTDFQEVPERSQLDISEPYKVYQILSDGAREHGAAWVGKVDNPGSFHPFHFPTPPPLLPARDGPEPYRRGWTKLPQESPPLSRTLEMGPHLIAPGPLPSRVGEHWSGQGQPRANVTSSVLLCSQATRASPGSNCVPAADINNSVGVTCWLHVRLYYRDVLVKEFTTHTAEGCRITSRLVPADNERLYGPSSMEQIQFPSPRALSGHGRLAGVAGVLERLLPHLDRGVLLWVAPEGVFMKRQCQGRVYWNGPTAPHRDRPNKLEREKTYKLLDSQQFLQQLRSYLSHGEPTPQYQIHLCFGEEYP
uniref:IRF tryptophan pentad repeat domain-containing protein n=1 Tax=Pelodiscus sinensis TaxID=13735 RepID=K7F6P2_PELSI